VGLIVAISGCPKTSAPDESATEASSEGDDLGPNPLTLLVLDDDQLGDTIARQWSARRNGELTIVNQTSTEFADANFEIAPNIDVLIYPPGMLGELESRDRLLQIPRKVWASEELNKDEFLRHSRSTLVRHGNETWGVPLGAPQFALMYNADRLNELKLEIPKDWDRFGSFIGKLEKSNPASEKKGDGSRRITNIELPLGRHWACQVFLARVAPAIRSRGKLSTVFDRNTLIPLIVELPFVEALAELKKIADGAPEQLELTPAEIYRHVLTGQTIVGMTWPSNTFAVPGPIRKKRDSNRDTNDAAIGFARLPGSAQWWDPDNAQWTVRGPGNEHRVDLMAVTGLMGSVSQSSRNTSTAFNFLQWLSSKSISLVTVVESPLSGPFRASHLGDPVRWTGTEISDSAAQQYGEVIQFANDQDVVLMFPRIPGRQRYLDALDQHIRHCLQGQSEPAAALEAVALEWEEITDALNRKQQAAELRNDAGL
jgi:ABC-type glycerol-3-phosphate transport system substrate-binding protein